MDFTRIHIAPPLKPGNDANFRASRRPFLLIRTAVKILGGILLLALVALIAHGTISDIDEKLLRNQFAHRIRRGADLVPAEIMEFASRSTNGGRAVYMVSSHVAGAFGVAGASADS